MTRAAPDPIVQRAVARPSVESNQFAIAPDPRHVGNAANIQDGQRPRQIRRQRGVIDGRERGALAAGRYVRGAEIERNGHSGAPRELRSVADLPGSVLVGLVQDGLAVEADQVRLAPECGYRTYV